MTEKKKNYQSEWNWLEYGDPVQTSNFHVEVTPSVTSVESSEEFWRKIRQIWCVCEP